MIDLTSSVSLAAAVSYSSISHDLRDRPLFLVSDSLNVSPQRRNPARFVFTITSRRLALAPQEIDSISPAPIPSFSCQSGQGPDQTADIRGRNCFSVHKNHTAMRSLFFRPGFEQRRNRLPVISNKRQSLGGGLLLVRTAEPYYLRSFAERSPDFLTKSCEETATVGCHDLQ
jgi:hypothetical protein